MIYLNRNGYPMSVDDTMDSAVRYSIMVLSGEDSSLLKTYEKDGIVVRCPEGPPSNNPKNCTWDQLSMLIAAFYKVGDIAALRRIFWACAKRGFFMQNFERDVSGSTKYPWPHSFWKDSIEGTVIERKNFDFADPITPDRLIVLVKAARIYWMYWIFPIAYPMHLLKVSAKKEGEFNQIIAECYVMGTLNKLDLQWNKHNWSYWHVRGEVEYATKVERIVNNESSSNSASLSDKRN